MECRCERGGPNDEQTSHQQGDWREYNRRSTAAKTATCWCWLKKQEGILGIGPPRVSNEAGTAKTWQSGCRRNGQEPNSVAKRPCEDSRRNGKHGVGHNGRTREHRNAKIAGMSHGVIGKVQKKCRGRSMPVTYFPSWRTLRPSRRALQDTDLRQLGTW